MVQVTETYYQAYVNPTKRRPIPTETRTNEERRNEKVGLMRMRSGREGILRPMLYQYPSLSPAANLDSFWLQESNETWRDNTQTSRLPRRNSSITRINRGNLRTAL